jgi:hypothetical protein
MSASSAILVGTQRVLASVSPPPVVGMANGVAQSIVSLARGFGPLLGGYVRSFSPGVLPRLTHISSYGRRRYKETLRDTTSAS